MAPQPFDDDDLASHEEPRQPMFGLIDDLPQMWGGLLGFAVMLFVVLVWVTAPNG